MSDAPRLTPELLAKAIRLKEQQISSLEVEVRALQRLLRHAKRVELREKMPARSTTYDRIDVEVAILTALGKSIPPEGTADALWLAASTAGLKSRSTFRSYLFRMKSRGLIISLGDGNWRLAPGITLPPSIDPRLERAIRAIQRG